MANKYTRKSKLEQKPSDEFVTFWQRAFEALRPYGRAIGLIAAGGLLVLVTGWVVNHFIVGKKETVTEAVGRALRIYEADLLDEKAEKEKAEKEKAEKDKDKDKDKDASEVPRFKTEKERLEATLAELDKVDKEYGSTDAALRGQLARAGVLFDLGRYDESEAAYRRYLEKAGESDNLRFLGREGVGLCAEAKGKVDEALKEYQELEKTPGDFYRDRSRFDQARIHVKKGDKTKAIEIYKDILAKSPQSPLKDDINARLALLGT